jgi:nucleotide-binding universal stress UspA family protein
MFEKILLPLDGSEVAELVLPYAAELAGRMGSELILFHVSEHGHLHHERMDQIYLDRLAENAFSGVGAGQSGAQIKLRTIMEAGEPAEDICKFVERNGISLIMITSVAATGLRIGKTLGSVADHVCRTVSVPVMIVRPQYIERTRDQLRVINRILLPLDGSDASKEALPVTTELAGKLKVPLTLFQMAHVVRPYADITHSDLYIDYAKVTEDEVKIIRDEMSELEKDLRDQGLDVAYAVTTGSDAADEIIKMGETTYVDLVVMATHGRSGLRRWALGSVAEKVLRHGDRPLLLVHVKAK